MYENFHYMGKIDEYIDFNQDSSSVISALKNKTIEVPAWDYLKKLYNFKEHEILKDTVNLRDKKRKDGTVEKSCRLSIGMERLLVTRMSEFMFSIPVKRIYHNTEGSEIRQKISQAIESIYKYSRISTHNLNRSKTFFACCEIFTLWYAVPSPNNLYGFDSKFKLKCKTFSPKDGTTLYPLFDKYGDMIAMSMQYDVTINNVTTTYFEAFTDENHYKWELKSSGWELESNPEQISLLKIPGVYLHRKEAIYEDVAPMRKEIEYTLSKNSNVISYNSAPILKVKGDIVGEEKKNEFMRMVRLSEGGDIDYVSWNQSVSAVSSHLAEMKELFWNLSQMPDISFSNMQRLGNIGYDARETLLTDAHLKVGDESGSWIEFFERETNVIKAFLKQMHKEWEDEIDNIEIEHIISPFIQRNEDSEINKRLRANGGKPIESQRESIQRYGKSQDADETLRQIREESEEAAKASIADVFESMK